MNCRTLEQYDVSIWQTDFTHQFFNLSDNLLHKGNYAEGNMAEDKFD